MVKYEDLTNEDKQTALDEAWQIMNPKTNAERLNNIKVEITKVRKLWKDEAYQEGDQILFDMEENHLDWLIERADRAQELEDAMKGAAVISNIANEEITKLEEENKRLREAHKGVINSSRDGSFPHVISTAALEDEN